MINISSKDKISTSPIISSSSNPIVTKEQDEALIEFSKNSLNSSNSNSCSEDDYSLLKENVEKIKDEQGLIGIVWDGFKNITGIGASSSKALRAVDDYENGKISYEKMQNAIESYKIGQNQCVDTVADIVAGLSSFAVFSTATATGLVLAPLTGGGELSARNWRISSCR